MVKGMSSFGFGQRTCLGQNLTNDETIVACAALLWSFNLKKKVDPVTGTEINPSLTASNSLLIIKPDPFEMAFEPRSDARRGEIIDIWKTAEAKDTRKREEFVQQHQQQHQQRTTTVTTMPSEKSMTV